MPIPLHSVWPSLPPPPPAQRGTGTRRFTFDLCQKNQVALWQMLSTTLNWVSSASECGCTSPCVPLLQASEKTELTMLWERAWPDVAISETPLSDWLEWLDCDSGWWLNKPEKALIFPLLFSIHLFILQKYVKVAGQTWKAGGTGPWLHGGRRERRPIIRSLCSSHCLLKVDVQLLAILRNRQNRKLTWKKLN